MFLDIMQYGCKNGLNLKKGQLFLNWNKTKCMIFGIHTYINLPFLPPKKVNKMVADEVSEKSVRGQTDR